MSKQHLKRIAAPKTWSLKKKECKFVMRPNPGAHTMDSSLPLGLILREILGYASTKRDIANILNRRNVKVNSKRRKDMRYPVGIMDTLSLEDIGEHYRVMINHKGKICLNKTNEKRARIRPVKIIDKCTLKSNVTQLNFSDGNVLQVKKDSYKIGDTLIMEYPNKILDHFKLEPGSYIYFTKGKQVGMSGVVEHVSKDKIIFKQKDGTKKETSKKYAFILGRDKPEVVLPE